MSLQDCYNHLEHYREWQHPDPNECGCFGTGWYSSDLDTYHECLHHGGTPHPEDDCEGGWGDVQWEAHWANNLRAAYRWYRGNCSLVRGVFDALCKVFLAGISDPQPRDWVEGARRAARYLDDRECVDPYEQDYLDNRDHDFAMSLEYAEEVLGIGNYDVTLHEGDYC